MNYELNIFIEIFTNLDKFYNIKKVLYNIQCKTIWKKATP